MRCPNEGKIQAYIDEELNDIEIKEMKMHLFQCEKCKETYENLKATNGFVFEKINDYNNGYSSKWMDRKDIDIEKVKDKKGEFNFMKKYKKVAVAACLGVVLTSCIAVQPIRAAISNAVSIFRANDIKGVNVSLDDIKKLQQELEAHKMDISIDNIGKVKQEGGENKTVTIDEAKKELPFTVLLPKGMNDKNIESVNMVQPLKVDFTLNIENVNQIIKSLGGKKLFPRELDGKNFAINLPGTLSFGYKNEANNKYISISESKIPEITGPSEENIDEIVNALSELPVLPQNIQKQIKAMKDWKTTLYIPNVENSLQELNIDGVKAFGYFENNKDYKNSSVLFLKDGVLVNINGNVDKNEIIEIVKSMR